MRILFTLILLCTSSTVFATEFYVAPSGNDSNAGTKSNPFATLSKARDAVRLLKSKVPQTEPVQIIVADGFYTLGEPLILSPEDGGTVRSPVIYQAAPGANPVFSGGREIRGWQAGPNGLWTVRIPEVAAGKWYFEQLFVNGRRAVRARTPNKGYFYIQEIREDIIEAGSPRQAKKARQFLRMRAEDFQTIANLQPAELRDVNLQVYHKWDNTRRFVERLEPDRHELITVGEGLKSWNSWRPNTRYHLENFYNAIDQPGEWFLARDGMLYYKPLPGEELTKAKVFAPIIDQFLLLQGNSSEKKFIEHVTFKGLTFRHTRWVMPSGGFEAAQAAAPIDAVVMLDGARHVAIEDCEFAHAGRYAIWFRKGCRDCLLSHCYLHDFGAGGVRIGETSIAPNEIDQTSHITVDNNIIRDGGHIFPCAVGVWIGQSGDNSVTHNEIANFYYTGISVGWRWGYAKSLAKRNTISFNHVHRLGKGVLSDMGGIYTLGPSEGTVVRNNVFHDVYAYSYGGWGLYTDEGSTGILFENNLVYDVKTGGFHQHYGKENIIRNNILAFSELYQVQASRVEDHLSFNFENNIIYWDNGVLLSGAWDKIKHVSGNNCYFHSTGEKFDFIGNTLAQWQAAGHEQGSIIADPLFENPKHRDFRLKSDSPALKIGFKPFNPSRAGVHGNLKWVQKASEVKYPAREVESDPPPLLVQRDFEHDKVNQQPGSLEIHVENQGDSILVTQESAASGKQSLKITDAPGLKTVYKPYCVFRGMSYQNGNVQNKFDLRIEKGAMINFEWRDWSVSPYLSGPRFTIRDGRLFLEDKATLTLPVSKWVRFEIDAELDARNGSSWQLSVKIPGQKPQVSRKIRCSNPKYAKLTWVGFISIANAKTAFYLDNFSLHFEPKKK